MHGGDLIGYGRCLVRSGLGTGREGTKRMAVLGCDLAIEARGTGCDETVAEIEKDLVRENRRDGGVESGHDGN